MPYKRILLLSFLSVAVFTLLFVSCIPQTTTNIQTTTTETNTNNTVTVIFHYKDGYGINPSLWIWKSGSSGKELPNKGKDENGLYVFETNLIPNTTYGIKVKSGTWWEPIPDRFLYISSAPTQEYWIISWTRGFVATSYAQFTSVVSNPPFSTDAYKLGANPDPSDPSKVNFLLFCSRASKVNIAGDFNSWSSTSTPMYLTPDGKYWWVQLTASDGAKYKYVINGKDWTADPYTRLAVYDGYGGYNSVVVKDTNFTWTDSSWTTPPIEDLVIYELHIHDYTAHSSSGVSTGLRGKFLGLLEKTNYLKALGINAVELMPIVAQENTSGYNWGYSPVLYFAPWREYATNEDTAIIELKTLINGLHEAGIAVILDVVFNHTGNNNNYLWTIDELYYFDYNNNGTTSDDSTTWGNHLATWRDMVKKLMYDNLIYWIEEYHVDGFRFDATWFVDHNALKEVISQVRAKYPNKIFIVEQLPNSTDFYGTGIAQWGALFHDKMKAMLRRGTFEGENYDNVGRVGRMIYYDKDSGCFANPKEVVNYFESHDENSVYAELVRFSGLTDSDAEKATKIGAIVLFTSMGIPMILEGQEFLRDKVGQDVTETNNLVYWDRLTTYTNVFEYYKGLINLRRNHPALRITHSDPDPAGYFKWLMSSGFSWTGKAIAYAINPNNNYGGDINEFIVLVNFDTNTQTIKPFYEAGTWYIIADPTNVYDISTAPTTNISDTNTVWEVPPVSGFIFMK